MPSGKILTHRVGHPAGLQFELQLCGASEARADSVTFGKLLVWLGEDLVWGRFNATEGATGVEWYWIELLEHLAANWRYLRYEQGYPFGVMPARPSGLLILLEERWSRPEIDEIAEEEVAYGFRDSHNLAMSLNGCVVPDLWFVREGRTVLVECKDRVRRYPHEREIETLERLGDLLFKRLSQLSDIRSIEAKETWEKRDKMSFADMVSIGTGESLQDLEALSNGVSLDDLFRDPLAASIEDNRTIDLVYRCKGLASAATLRRLLEDLKGQSEPPSPALEELTRKTQGEKTSLEERDFPPFKQGHKLALTLRHDPDLFSARDDRAEPENLLQALGVKVQRRSFDSHRLDAVGIWGQNLNPWVILNLHDKHLQNMGAQRATIAHELCHILVDRNDVLPLSAVVGGRMDRAAEQRANSFAAELLCPRFYVRGLYEQLLSAVDVIDAATQRFGVSRELAALQLARADCQLGRGDEEHIESLVSPDAYLPWSLY